MTSFEELKQQLLEAGEEATVSTNSYLDTARAIINIERQAFYGEEGENKRLSRIREVFSEAVKRNISDEA